ncbi:hypothetical protein DERP_003376, partial [Dermatophagoides pteronyssinus]
NGDVELPELLADWARADGDANEPRLPRVLVCVRSKFLRASPLATIVEFLVQLYAAWILSRPLPPSLNCPSIASKPACALTFIMAIAAMANKQ